MWQVRTFNIACSFYLIFRLCFYFVKKSGVHVPVKSMLPPSDTETWRQKCQQWIFLFNFFLIKAIPLAVYDLFTFIGNQFYNLGCVVYSDIFTHYVIPTRTPSGRIIVIIIKYLPWRDWLDQSTRSEFTVHFTF